MPSGLLLTLGNQKFPNVNKKHTPNRLRKWQWIKAAKMGTAIELETRHTVQVVEAPQGFLYYSQHLVFILREGQLSHHRKLQKK